MRPALRGALLLGGLLVTLLGSTATAVAAWFVGACVAADTSATPAVSYCVQRSGSPSLPVACTSHEGFVETPTSSPGAAAMFAALLRT